MNLGRIAEVAFGSAVGMLGSGLLLFAYWHLSEPLPTMVAGSASRATAAARVAVAESTFAPLVAPARPLPRAPAPRLIPFVRDPGAATPAGDALAREIAAEAQPAAAIARGNGRGEGLAPAPRVPIARVLVAPKAVALGPTARVSIAPKHAALAPTARVSIAPEHLALAPTARVPVARMPVAQRTAARMRPEPSVRALPEAHVGPQKTRLATARPPAPIRPTSAAARASGLLAKVRPNERLPEPPIGYDEHPPLLRAATETTPGVTVGP